MITIGMATFQLRQESLALSLNSLLPQCDKINLYLNDDQSKLPSGLPRNHKNKIEVFVHPKGDLKDSGKFYQPPNEGYFFTVDDDIQYPADYTEKMIGYIESLNRYKIVGVHGCRLRQAPKSIFNDRLRIYHFQRGLAGLRAAHVVGTGTVAYHTDTFYFDWTYCKSHGMADMWFAAKAQKEKVPRCVVPRERFWLKHIAQPHKYNLFENKPSLEMQAHVIREGGDWGLL